MALTPTQRIRQAQVLAAADGAVMNIVQAQVLAIYNIRTVAVHVTQAQVLAPITAALRLRITQAQVLAVVKGRIDDWELRAWTFSLDGHNFYVLKIGMAGTLVYDTETKQWTDWRTFGLRWWRLFTGMNWLGMSRVTFGSNDYPTNIVAGDDATGRLWILDPTHGFDESPQDGRDDVLMERLAMGQIPLRNRDVITCGAVFVTCSVGRPAVSAAEILLSTSDDDGQTWAEHGAITVDPDAWEQQITWRSLGRMRAPGRLFRLTDDGAVTRISDMSMPDGQ